jgi:tetratricopeptide (TPR) repeat protein
MRAVPCRYASIRLTTHTRTQTPENHILYANRAACFMSNDMNRSAEALTDAKHCVELAPHWFKGYVRKAQAEYLLKRYADAEATCRAGLALENLDDQSAVKLRSHLQTLRDAGHRTDLADDKLGANVKAAQEEKARGNSAFQAKKWEEAAGFFTKAIELDPTDHIFWSNRSAAFAEQDQFENALRDAQYCVDLKPDWAKGYSRLATALYNLGRYPDCLKTVEDGLKLDPEHAGLKPMVEGLRLDVAEGAEVQARLHGMRADARRQDKMMKMLNGMSGMNIGNAGFGGSRGGGGFGGLNMGGLGGLAGQMTDAQMRTMARAMDGKGGFNFGDEADCAVDG